MIPAISASLILVLAVASSAWAEGAWVVWNEYSIGTEDPAWRVLGAAKTNEECAVVLKSYLAGERSKLVSPNDATILKIEGNTARWVGRYTGLPILTKRFVCLPDTVDPRR